MSAEIIPFSIPPLEARGGKFIHSRCKSVRRRMNWLLWVAWGEKIVRDRTIRRCYEVMERKESQLSRFLHHLRRDPDGLRIVLAKYIELVSRSRDTISDHTELIESIMSTEESDTEIEMIIELLKLLWLSHHDIISITTGHIRGKINTIADLPGLWNIAKMIERGKKN